MQIRNIAKFIVVVTLVSINLFGLGCSEAIKDEVKESDSGNQPQSTNEIEWEKVPAKYNPSTEQFDFLITDVKRLYVSPFGNANNVKIVYSNNVKSPNGFLKNYKVWQNQASWGYLGSDFQVGGKLEVNHYGNYQCSIRIVNREITELDGGCYVKIEIHLPVNSKVEVYYASNRISELFHEMTLEELTKSLESALNDSYGLSILDDFIESHKINSKKPAMASRELGSILDFFEQVESKYEVLSKLNLYITDRRNLLEMVNEQFSISQRPRALAILGLD